MRVQRSRLISHSTILAIDNLISFFAHTMNENKLCAFVISAVDLELAHVALCLLLMVSLALSLPTRIDISNSSSSTRHSRQYRHLG